MRRRDSVQLDERFTVPLPVIDRANEWLESGTMLRRLRAMAPPRPLTLAEAWSVTERQALRMLAVSGVDRAPVPIETVAELSRVQVRYVEGIPVAGASTWGRGVWTITVEARQSWAERKMVVAHEFKHILDHSSGHDRYLDPAFAEPAADFFARCLFMPRPWFKHVVATGVQRPAHLAERFRMPIEQVVLRLLELGLSASPQRRGCRSLVTFFERARPGLAACWRQ